VNAREAGSPSSLPILVYGRFEIQSVPAGNKTSLPGLLANYQGPQNGHPGCFSDRIAQRYGHNFASPKDILKYGADGGEQRGL